LTCIFPRVGLSKFRREFCRREPFRSGSKAVLKQALLAGAGRQR